MKKRFKNIWFNFKYFFKEFRYLKVYFSPFIRPKLSLYFGKVNIGTPYFYPRKWVKATPKLAHEATLNHIKIEEFHNKANPNSTRPIKSYDEIYQEKLRYKYAVPKKIGFDFVPLGWKTKWDNKDIRFEYAPLISFVFFKWQIVLFFNVPQTSNYWESWIFYSKYTNKKESVEKRLIQAMQEYPMICTIYKQDSKQKVNYWNDVLKKEYLKLVPELKQETL